MKWAIVLILGIFFEANADRSNTIQSDVPTINTQEDDYCGYPPKNVRIVNGTEATPNEFPWMVHLRINANRFVCGGSLIELDVVLSAGHCVNRFEQFGGQDKLSTLYIYAGDHNLSKEEAAERRMNAVEIRRHEHYSDFGVFNDIALIKLSQPFTRTKEIQPISLPSQGPITATSAEAMGWGATKWNSSISYVLKKVTLPVVTGEQCNKQTSTNIGSQICAGGNLRDSCQGDSGGPLVCYYDKPVVCGIVSFGKGCACPDIPGVYTNVSYFLEWVNYNKNFLPPTTTTTKLPNKNSANFAAMNCILILTALSLNILVG